LKALKTHESELPPVEEVLKAHYLGAYSKLEPHYAAQASGTGIDPPSVADQTQGNLFVLAQQTPWEQARTKRLINVQYADAFADRPSDPSLERRYPWLRVTGPGDWARTQLAAKRGLCHVRAVQLELALLRYECEKKKPARSLADLVPNYLDGLPADPFTRRDFRYRISSGESIPVVGTAKETLLEPARRQGVVWSTGPDRNDDGGRVQGLDADNPSDKKGLDWIFLVPQRRRP